jgi:integration host factor subunit alpha
MGLSKKDIVKDISDKAYLKSSTSSQFFEALLQILKKNISKNIKISNFGTFLIYKSPQRIGRNPRTKEEYQIKSRTKISFRASSKIKRILN